MAMITNLQLESNPVSDADAKYFSILPESVHYLLVLLLPLPRESLRSDVHCSRDRVSQRSPMLPEDFIPSEKSGGRYQLTLLRERERGREATPRGRRTRLCSTKLRTDDDQSGDTHSALHHISKGTFII